MDRLFNFPIKILRTIRSRYKANPKLYCLGFLIIFLFFILVSLYAPIGLKSKTDILFWTFSTIVQAFVGLLAFLGMLGIFRLEQLERKLERLEKLEMGRGEETNKTENKQTEIKNEMKLFAAKTGFVIMVSIICLPITPFLITVHLDLSAVMVVTLLSLYCVSSAAWLIRDLLFEF